MFLPARGYLRYLRLQVLVPMGLAGMSVCVAGVLLIVFKGAARLEGWLLLVIGVGTLLAMPFAAALLWLRYQTTWYALGRRSLRTRSGLWVIRETTITYENVQNVEVVQGPLQRLLGISTLRIETAGGSLQSRRSGGSGLTWLGVLLEIALSFIPGGAVAHGVGAGHHKRRSAPGSLEGIAQPAPLRAQIMDMVRRSSSAGLGDEGPLPATGASPGRAVTAEHVDLLRQIRGKLLMRGRGTEGLRD